MKGIAKCTNCVHGSKSKGKYVRCLLRGAIVDSSFAYICEFFERRGWNE